MELWCQQSAQRIFNPQSAGATPAGSTILYPWSLRADAWRSLPAPSDLSRGLSRRARAAKGPVCKVGYTAGATPAVVSIFHGAVMIIAACRARNADETERNRPAPPICPGGVDRCTTAFQADGAGAIPAPGTTGLGCPSGRVGFQIRPGGCESLRACQFNGG